jgi:hypothetical protein
LRKAKRPDADGFEALRADLLPAQHSIARETRT